jgi:hypothetical protein
VPASQYCQTDAVYKCVEFMEYAGCRDGVRNNDPDEKEEEEFLLG